MWRTSSEARMSINGALKLSVLQIVLEWLSIPGTSRNEQTRKGCSWACRQAPGQQSDGSSSGGAIAG